MEFQKISKIFIIAIVAIVSFLSGIYTADKSAVEKKGYDTGYGAGYAAAWNKAEETVDSSKVAIYPAQKEVFIISGIIKTISLPDKSLTMEANPVSTNPFSENSKSTIRTIKITPSTEIVKRKLKNSEEIKAMVDIKQSQDYFMEVKMFFGDIQAGGGIAIISDKNIKQNTEITALKIVLQ